MDCCKEKDCCPCADRIERLETHINHIVDKHNSLVNMLDEWLPELKDKHNTLVDATKKLVDSLIEKELL